MMWINRLVSIFAQVAVGRVAELAKQIIGLLLRTIGGPIFATFAGCSTGGREAMLMTQRYPRREFDGVDFRDPAMRTG